MAVGQLSEWDGGHMYGSIRVFRVKPGTGDVALEQTWRACKKVLATNPGFIDMHTVRCGPDEFLTIGIYESQEMAAAAFVNTNPVFWAAVSKFFASEPLRFQGDLKSWDDVQP